MCSSCERLLSLSLSAMLLAALVRRVFVVAISPLKCSKSLGHGHGQYVRKVLFWRKRDLIRPITYLGPLLN